MDETLRLVVARLVAQLRAAIPGKVLTPTYDPAAGFSHAWNPALGPGEQATADGIVSGFDWNPTPAEKIAGTTAVKDKLYQFLAALALRAGSQWSGLTTNQKNAVQSVIDEAASAVIAKLTS